MPARAAWKGFLQINQLQVPVKAFTAVSTQPEIALNQLHRGCGQRIRQLKVCPLHGEITSEEIVSGYEYADRQYLALEESDLTALRAEDGKAITVDCFVDSKTIDPVYHAGRTYYVVPDGPPGQRPFCVLRDGMRSVDRHAVSRVVMSHRELLVLIRPHGRLLAMTVLEYPQRVRPATEYEGDVSQLTVGQQEQELIGQLISAMTEPELDLSRYEDAYTEGLNALISRKQAEITPELQEASSGADDTAMVALLRATLVAAGVEDGVPARIPSRTVRGGYAEGDGIRKSG